MFKIKVLKDNFVSLLSAALVLLSLFFLYKALYEDSSFSTSRNKIYVLDMKRIVDRFYADTLKKERNDPSGVKKYEKEFEYKLKRLSALVNSYDFPIFSKGAIVNYKNDQVVDLTETLYQKISSENIDSAKGGTSK